MNYTVGQIVLYMDDGCPVEGIIESVNDDMVRIKVIKYNQSRVSDWKETRNVWELDTLEEKYKQRYKNVQRIKQRLDTPETLIRFLYDHLDYDFDDASEIDQACMERIKELFGFDVE